MRFDVITLFPESFRQCLQIGVVGRAFERGLARLEAWNPRDFTHDNYRRIDERPFGGGPGMVMMVDPLQECLQAVRAADAAPARVIYLSPQGRPFTQAKARELAALPRLILLAGRYEGVDQRFLDAQVDEEISIGDFVLSGNHALIARWRRKQSLGQTWLKRPDLLAVAALSKTDRTLLAEFQAEQAADLPEKAGNP